MSSQGQLEPSKATLSSHDENLKWKREQTQERAEQAEAREQGIQWNDTEEKGNWLRQFKAFSDADVLTPDERDYTRLPLSQIRLCEGVFQPRQFRFNAEDSVKQVASLKKAIQRRRFVGKLLVWKAGGEWYCIDGHHRLKAYRDVAESSAAWRESLKTVAVKVFVGDKKEAHSRSIAENAEDKLPTTHDDKQEAAWRMVLQGEQAFTRPRIAELAQIGERTVGKMRTDLKACQDGRYGLAFQNPARFTWWQLKKGLLQQKPLSEQNTKDRSQIDSYKRQLGKLERRLQGPRCVRLLMEAMKELNVKVLTVAVEEGQRILSTAQGDIQEGQQDEAQEDF